MPRALKPEFRISQSYYIPHDQTPAELKQSGVHTTTSSWEGAGYWHNEDYFFVPLIGSGGQFVGIMSLDDPQDRRAPDRSTVETIEIFANQAALAIENARLYQSAENQTAKLSKSLEELQKSYRDLDAVSRTLARKDQELGSLIGQTDVRAKRLLALHRIASSAAELRDEQAIFAARRRSDCQRDERGDLFDRFEQRGRSQQTAHCRPRWRRRKPRRSGYASGVAQPDEPSGGTAHAVVRS